MARDLDPFKLSSPRIFLVRMMVFLILCALIIVVLHKQIVVAFMANPGLNALIIAVLVIGILLSFRQVIRLFPEVRWVNGFREQLLPPYETEIGWTLGREHWNRGYATEGALACRDWALGELGLTRLVSIIASDNTASIRVAEKIGERFERPIQGEFFRLPVGLWSLGERIAE